MAVFRGSARRPGSRSPRPCRTWPFGVAAALSIVLASASSRAADRVPAGPAVDPFRGVRFEYARTAMRERLARLRMDSANEDAYGVRQVVISLANAVENMPSTRDVDVAAAARTMRDDLPYDVGRSPLDADVAIQSIRESLEVAADALLRVARGALAWAPWVADRVQLFQRAADAIEPDRGLGAQRAVIVGALNRSDEALSTIEDVWRPSPRPVSARGDPGSASSLGPPARWCATCTNKTQ